MDKIKFKNVKIGLTNEQILLLHEKSLELIKRIGIRVPHDKVIDLISNYNGVKIKNKNVCFSEDLVKKAIKSAYYDFPNEFKNDYIIVGGAHQDKIYDIYSGNLRKATYDDLLKLTRICDHLNVTGSAPVRPMDKPTYLQEILMYKASWEYSRNKGNNIFEHNPKSTVESAKYIYEMAQVAKKRFALNLWVISPRNFSQYDLDVIYYFKDKKIPMCVTTMPVAGTTAPINLLGAYLQAMYELFSGLTLLSLLNPNGQNYCAPMDNIRAYTFDMKFGNFVYGSPEDIKGTIYQVNLNSFYKLPMVAKSLLTTAKEPNGQACFEKGVHTMTAMLLGVKGFTNAGLLSVDEIYSAEQLIIDKEIVDYCKALTSDIDFSEENLLIDEIMQTGPNQTFLNKDSTLRDYKKLLWEPKLFIHNSLGQWEQSGKQSLYARANKMVKDILDKHNYEIETNIKKELDKIYKIASKDKILENSFKH
ncbi:MAG: trimethylamine methyltransferase family protein [Actinobacteria bacterium]|nr:trimethylamine methyltransferase family protein [Actinomycetota bacterium]